jgi:multidrug resistance efflux pump
MSEEIVTNQIEIHSEEVEEVFGRVPNYFIRWGMSIIVGSTMLFILGSWFFKYPDIVKVPITISTENPPAAIVAKTNGKIQELLVKDNQKTERNNIVAFVENTADYKDVLALKKMLQGYTTTDLIANSLPKLNEFNIGDIKPYYASFVKCYNQYIAFLKIDYYNKKLESVKKQIEKIKLHSDVEKNENAFLAEIQLSQLEQTSLDLQYQFVEHKSKLESDFKDALDNLNRQIVSWEQTYLLKAPISGRIAFSNDWSRNQNIKAGDIVFTVVPDSMAQIIGIVNISDQLIGKIKVGQKVHIKFDSYPYMEYGFVEGVIKSISLIPSNHNYPLEIIFPKGLTTIYGNVLKFNFEMQGTAEIITDDLRLFDRLMKPVKSALKTY